MVSYRQLASGSVVLHERETTSSGRPKPTLAKEDANCFYTQSRSGQVSPCQPKTDMELYWDFITQQVIYTNRNPTRRGDAIGTYQQIRHNDADSISRNTPITDYEIQMGLYHGNELNPFNIGYLKNEWSNTKSSNSDNAKNRALVTQKVNELQKIHLLKIAQAEEEAELIRLQKVRESARPNPKEVEKVEPVEVKPIEEVAKYSPLMIAGVIAVVVILLLKRRRA